MLKRLIKHLFNFTEMKYVRNMKYVVLSTDAKCRIE